METLIQELYIQFLRTKNIYTETDYDATTQTQRDNLKSEFCALVTHHIFD